MKMRLLLALLVLAFATTGFGQRTFDVLVPPAPSVTTTNTSLVKSNRPNFSIMAVVVVNTPVPIAFNCAVTDICTSTAYTGETGLKVQVSTTTTIPTGLALATDYFVIKLTDTTFSLATTLVNALAGTPIDVTGIGSGTHTMTATALAGASIKLQGSIDCVNYIDMAGTSTAVTVSANTIWTFTAQPFRCVRSQATLTAGQLSTYVMYAEPVV